MIEREHTRYGFTLIELSIVLVIIGLIVGGVLVGKDLIKAAENRSIVTQIEKYNTAVMAFMSKYNCLPGDCAKAVAMGLGTAGGVGDNGDGDGRLNTDTSGNGEVWNNFEPVNFWYHLSMAKLIDGNYSGGSQAGVGSLTNPDGVLPKTNSSPQAYITAASTVISVNNTWAANMYMLAQPSGSNFDYALTPLQGYYIDSKIDDGIPNRGSVRTSHNVYTPNFYTPDAVALFDSQNLCVYDTISGPNTIVSPPRYNMTASNANNRTCIVGVKAVW